MSTTAEGQNKGSSVIVPGPTWGRSGRLPPPLPRVSRSTLLPQAIWPPGAQRWSSRSLQTSLAGRHIEEGLLEGDFPEDILPLPVPHTYFT